MRIGHLLEHAGNSEGESFQALVDRPGVRVERIVSSGMCPSPAGFWYEQAEAEWVMVVSGEARLRFQDGERVVHLRPGEWVDIAPGEKHRVDWTLPEGVTVWLAVFYA
ncbi:cupin 2 domain-containing protein [Fluviicoccus keumensis]|uniref:Cupin 2 domain-containing protein n=1 Tax=Fluviicoccus keumensis TaxID=1435465 RepID=A0A4Q7ZAW4_9GAMM|nr:cupin domain-containing protein [Fluviicoccus keumensis]RZU47055.1 cupin 2 domain-containing protein [Fluviicoccus keumensis]